MRVMTSMLIPLALIGCATTQPSVTSAPMPDDLNGWSTPVVEPPTPEPLPALISPDRPASPVERVYAFEPGAEYKVDVAVGFPLDLMLQPGEILNNQTHGDRAPLPPGDEQPPWEIRVGASGQPEAPHVFITVTKPGLATGLTLTTNKRVYLITLRSVGKSRVRAVRWTYDDELVRTVAAPRLLPDPTQPQRYHVGYAMDTSAPTPVWMPRQTLDDGRKTFVLLPTNLATMPAPMVRLIGPNGFELVNARQVGSVLVLDHLFNVAELRIGVGPTAETVRITRQAPRTIACPGDGECPLWPETQVAGR